MRFLEWLISSFSQSTEQEDKVAVLEETQQSVMRAASDLRDMADTMCANVTSTVGEVVEDVTSSSILPSISSISDL